MYFCIYVTWELDRPSVGWEQARDCVCEGIGYSDNKKGVSYRVGTNVQLEHYTQFSHPFV